MEPTVVRTGDPREIVVYAEHVLGFLPTESVVAVSLAGPRLRTGLVVRLDLADAVRPGAAEQIASHLRADGARRAVVLVHTSAPVPPHGAGRAGLGSLPRARTAATWRKTLRAAGIESVETWLVSADRLRSYTCSDACCPPRGLRFERSRTRMEAEFVARGSALAPDRQAWRAQQLSVLAPAAAGARRPVEAAALRWAPRGDPRASTSAARAEVVRSWTSALAAGAAALRGDEPGPDDPRADIPAAPDGALAVAVAAHLDPGTTGRLLAAVGDHHLRDTLLGIAVPSASEDRWGRSADPDEGADEGVVVLAAAEVLRAAVRLASPARRAEPLAMLAWLLWWQGLGAPAVLHAEAALECDPAHSLAGLVAQAAGHAVRAQGPVAAPGPGGVAA